MTSGGTTTADRLERPDPDYDPCFMPTGNGLCCLPGTHGGGCLAEPVGYPPLVTVVVEA